MRMMSVSGEHSMKDQGMSGEALDGPADTGRMLSAVDMEAMVEQDYQRRVALTSC